jgi:predicted ATPase
MRILRLNVEGFRSLKSQSWCPGDLNIIIGPNASGKSNLLRVLELLNASARRGLGRYIQQEGGMEPIVWDGRAPNVRIGAEFGSVPLMDPANPDSYSVSYHLSLGRLGMSGSYRIDRDLLDLVIPEATESPKPTRYLDRRPGQALVYSINSAVFEAPAESVPEEETLLAFAAGPFTANLLIDAIQRELASGRIYQSLHTHREAPIRTPQVTRAEIHVEPDGRNLISVLHTLYTTNREFKDEVNTAMRSAFGEDFEELVFPPAADQRIQLRIRWRCLSREQSAADLSDGLLRFLFLLAILANPSPPPLTAIDEPETGLPTSVFPIIAEYARDASNRSQVILTTHSPEFLDAFGEDIPTTTVVEWKNGETQLRTLSGDELTYWLRQYSLGELYRSRELEAMR